MAQTQISAGVPYISSGLASVDCVSVYQTHFHVYAQVHPHTHLTHYDICCQHNTCRLDGCNRVIDFSESTNWRDLILFAPDVTTTPTTTQWLSGKIRYNMNISFAALHDM
jgi:hypothetical protein